MSIHYLTTKLQIYIYFNDMVSENAIKMIKESPLMR